MSTEDKARDRMMHHTQMAKNRQESMLSRSAEEVGLDATDDSGTKIQGKVRSDVRNSCGRSGSSMS